MSRTGLDDAAPAATAGDVVPVHPERTGDPATLRWHLARPLAGLPFDEDGAARAAEPLRLLVDAGVLAGFALGSDSVATTLAPDRSWASAGAGVRAAVQATVREHARRLDAAGPGARDTLLARVAREVIADVVAPAAATHGGSIEFVDAHDGVISVRMRGACHGCPASSATLHGLLERQVREHLPWLDAVHVTTDGASTCPSGETPPPGGRRFVSILRRGSRPSLP